MKKTLLLIVIGLNVFPLTNSAFAQDTLLFHGKRNKIGFLAGDGVQYIGQLIGNNNHNIALRTTYYYKVNFYQLQYYITGLRKKTFGIDILFQPQYNLTRYKMYDDDDSTGYLKGHEVGLNIGFVYRKNTPNNFLSCYMSISSGPHYVSGTPHRQSSGFVFSNNLSAGVNLRVYKNLYADIRTGIRHISNAGFKIPNAGVNDMILNEGLMIVF